MTGDYALKVHYLNSDGWDMRCGKASILLIRRTKKWKKVTCKECKKRKYTNQWGYLK
jgi:hypothetical protein